MELPSPDLTNLDCIFSYEEYPKIFRSELFVGNSKSSNSNLCNSTNIINLFQKQSYSELINLKNEIKELNDFPETYTTFYPYDSELGKKCFETIKSQSRFRHHELFMLWFPEYYFLYKNTLDTILENKEGYLPLTWKLYLGIMAAATVRNEFLMKSLEADFILMGGDEDWLVFGIMAAPEKIRKLEILNNILAHQPWKLKMQDIKDVCNFNSISAWNIEDLVQSVIVLTTFHRLATVLESIKISVKTNEEKVFFLNDEIKSQNSLSKISSVSKPEKNSKLLEESFGDRKFNVITGEEVFDEETSNMNKNDNKKFTLNNSVNLDLIKKEK